MHICDEILTKTSTPGALKKFDGKWDQASHAANPPIGTSRPDTGASMPKSVPSPHKIAGVGIGLSDYASVAQVHGAASYD